MKKIILGLISLFLSIPNFADAQNKNCTDEVIREVDFFLIRQEKVYYPSFTDYKGKIHSPDTHIEFSFKNPTNKKIKNTYYFFYSILFIKIAFKLSNRCGYIWIIIKSIVIFIC